MKALAIIICFIFTSGCLKAKKSPFDLSSPSGFGGFFFLSQNSQQGIGTGTSTGTGTGSTTTSFSVTGSISGFTAGSLILQNNAANDLTLTATNTYSFTGLASGSIYAITIKTNPTGFVCSIVNASGTITANVTNANITCAVMTVNPAYTTNGLKWNDYINRDFSKDIFSQADTACNTANTGGYRTCVHAGEIRKFDIPSRSTCTGLTATDNLSALNWICKTNSTTGGVSFYSSGLKKGKYLSDLIDWTNNIWQSLTITVKDGTTTHAVSNALKPWTNLIDVTETTTPSTAGTVYLYKSNTIATNGISPSAAADRTSLLFKSNTASSIVNLNSGTCSGGSGLAITKNFTWIEGKIDLGASTGNRFGISLNSANFNVLQNVGIQNVGTGCIGSGQSYGINISSSSNNLLENVYVANTLNASVGTGTGIFLASSSYNSLINVVSTNNYSNGIDINTGSNGNIIIGALAMNSSNGININANDLVIANFTGVNTLTMVINFGAGVFSNSFYKNISLVNSNNGLAGGSVTWNNNSIENIALMTFSSSYEVQPNAANNNYFTGVLKRSTTTNTCQFPSGGTNPGLISPGCNKQGASDFNSSNLGNAYVISSLSGTFGGLSSTDTKNTSTGLSGSPGLSYASVTDWLNFDSFFKGVGTSDGTAFPTSGHRGRCVSGSPCATIFDFSLKTTDTVLRNANITGGGTGCPTAATMFTHTWIATSQAACNNVIGATFNGTTCTSTILRNSVELINDGVGNDNGLCEANEDCLLTPNIGAYQGHGNLVSSSTLSGGCPDVTTQGIKLYQYDTNGY